MDAIERIEMAIRTQICLSMAVATETMRELKIQQAELARLKRENIGLAEENG